VSDAGHWIRFDGQTAVKASVSSAGGYQSFPNSSRSDLAKELTTGIFEVIAIKPSFAARDRRVAAGRKQMHP
jgi:hypothetical protein